MPILFIFVPRHLEHNVISYYEVESNSNLLLQFVPLEEDNYEDFITRDINTDESNSFQEWLLNSYATSQNKGTFEYLRQSDFNYFFTSSGVDTPRCLLNTWSSRRSVNKHLILKLSNYITRHGKRQHTINLILNAISLSYLNYTSNLADSTPHINWRSIFTIISLAYYKPVYSNFPSDLRYANIYNFSYDNLGKEHNDFLDMRNVTLTNIKSINPIYSFYIYKVDKAIYKNSRGKSGKYTFIWKYLPPYKRKQLVLAWIAKEIKMQQGRTLTDRINLIINTISTNPNALFINKVQSFSTNYVYRNSRKSLCETYRTTTR